MRSFDLLKISARGAAVAFGALCLATSGAVAGPYLQTNLVSDIAGLAAIADPELVHPWGASHTPTSPFWTSNQGKSTATLYTVKGVNVSKVNINPPSGFVAITAAGPQGPTGQVNNSNAASFPVGNGGNGGSAHFIFASLNGTISAWDTGPTAFIQAATAGAVYTGLAVNTAQTFLYAANGAGNRIDVFDASFANVTGTTFAGKFIDPALPAGLVPFNAQSIGGNIYVTYAPAGRPAQTMAAEGQGAVAVFDAAGNFIEQLIDGGKLAAPWGMALAPADFGAFSNDLLVGNFSFLHSQINAFDPTSGAFLGTIPIDVGAANTAGGLWDLIFGNGGNGGSPNILYVTDGINGERDGLFAAISVPEPSSLALAAGALGLLLVRRRRARR